MLKLCHTDQKAKYISSTQSRPPPQNVVDKESSLAIGKNETHCNRNDDLLGENKKLLQ